MPNGIGPNLEYPSITESDRLHARALRLIPAATQTLAKGPGQYVGGVAPKYLERGQGGHVWDVDGNEYIDLNMGFGPISLGYAHPAVDDAIRAQLADGITFSQMHPLEVEVAEMVRALVPGAEMVRYSKTGCDVTSAAVRLARAYTGREGVVCAGYHGWHDWYIATTDRHRGVPVETRALTRTFDYNDVDSAADAIGSDTACVVVEPSTFEAPRPGFLEELRRLCSLRGALLVFDELWTGFRLGLGGAQERFGVQADLACFSKAIANGMPLSVLTGRRDVMRMLERDVFFFTTFGGEALSLAAARATLREMVAHGVPRRLEELGNVLRDGYNRIAASMGIDFSRCVGFGCRSLVTFEARGLAAGAEPLELKSLVQQELIRHGVLWSGFHNLCFTHTEEDVGVVLRAYEHALAVLKAALAGEGVPAALRGTPIEPVFRRVSPQPTRSAPTVRRSAEAARVV
jgi:glutamate-1-semialdehyde aminotransferase